MQNCTCLHLVKVFAGAFTNRKPDAHRAAFHSQPPFAFRVLTAKASWNSNTSTSAMVSPAFSSTLGVAYVGLKQS